MPPYIPVLYSYLDINTIKAKCIRDLQVTLLSVQTFKENHFGTSFLIRISKRVWYGDLTISSASIKNVVTANGAKMRFSSFQIYKCFQRLLRKCWS